MRHIIPGLLVQVFLLVPTSAAQEFHESRVNLSFNHLYDYEQLTEALKDLAEAYPELCTLESIGQSHEGRQMWVMTINNRATGSDRDKPAIYIDGNVHGNEVQASEVCLYTLWYLTRSYGKVPKLTELMDRCVFYVLPSVNPDGRAHWFDAPNTSSSSRSGTRPTDSDDDGLMDEDGYDDLDGDGQITMMWRPDPDGRFRRSLKDPRIFGRVGPDEKGDYSRIGLEGIDNDGDGDINEDGPGGYDMNRNWPSDWQPNHVQFGAGDYPFSFPETACIGRFFLDHPNIAAVQSYHNAGGMILRGPGAEYRESYYPRQDVAVYDEMGRTGEKLIPYYTYMVIYKDLYTVHGGFVNWTWEGLGIFSFTNELWSNPQYYYGKEGDWTREEQQYRFNDLLQFDQLFVPLKPYQHPEFGEILIGGFTKYASRVPPLFMLEELCHRNFAFTVYHADQMPDVSISRTGVRAMGPDTWEVTVAVSNSRIIPSVSALAASRGIGERDWIRLNAAEGQTNVLVSGTLSGWTDKRMRLTEHVPARIWIDSGIPGRGQRIFRWIVEGSGSVEIEYFGRKSAHLRETVRLEEAERDLTSPE